MTTGLLYSIVYLMIDNQVITKEQLISYLVDVNGYSVDYLYSEFPTKEDLKELITDWPECMAFSA